MPELRDLGAGAQKLLDLFVAQLEALEVEVPETRMVTPGSIPAWDSEMLCVNLARLEQGQPGAPQPGTMYRSTYYATFAVCLIRVVPALFGDGQPGPAMIPSPEDTTASGLLFFDDAAALALSATAIHESYAFTGPGEGFEPSAVTPIGPQGGMAGNQILVAASVT